MFEQSRGIDKTQTVACCIMAATPHSPLPDDRLEVRILCLGTEFSYTVTSFSVLTVKLRQAMMRVETIDSDGKVALMDLSEIMLCWTELNLSRSCLVAVSMNNFWSHLT